MTDPENEKIEQTPEEEPTVRLQTFFDKHAGIIFVLILIAIALISKAISKWLGF